MLSMLSWPMALVKIGSRYSMPSREGWIAAGIVERGMHVAGVDDAPTVAEAVAVEAVDMEPALLVPLQRGDAVVLPFDQHLDRLAAQVAPRRTGRTAAAVRRVACALALRVKIASLADSLRACWCGNNCRRSLDQNSPQRSDAPVNTRLPAGSVERSGLPTRGPASSTTPSPQTITTFFCRS